MALKIYYLKTWLKNKLSNYWDGQLHQLLDDYNKKLQLKLLLLLNHY